jgi:hypothetical protein
VDWVDPLWRVAELFGNRKLAGNLLLEFKRQQYGPHRQYQELNTGKWWERADQWLTAHHPVNLQTFLRKKCVILQSNVRNSDVNSLYGRIVCLFR